MEDYYFKNTDGGEAKTVVRGGEQYTISGGAGLKNHRRMDSMPKEQTVTIQTKNKQYTIGQKTLDWIRGRYKQSFDGYYGFDDEDQYNKANGIMPRSFQNGYGNNDWDRQLLELGLPSSKYLDQYLEDYHAWYGDGQYLQFDKNQSEYIKTQSQKGWEYSDSVEDMRRQARGIMPVKEEAKYKDKNGNFLSYADEMYFSMGLPPTSELGAHINSLNDYSHKLSRVDEFYTAAANNAVENLLLKGIKNDDTLYEQEDGTKVKGSDLWRTSYYSFINGSEDWSDIRSWVQPDETEQGFKPDASWSVDKTEEERMAWESRQAAAAKNADDPYRIDPSYNDFLNFFEDNADSVYTQKVANESVAKVFGTVGEVIDDAHSQNVAAMYSGITDEETLTAVLKARAADDPAQVIRDLKEYDVPKRLIRKAKNQLLDSNADEAVKQSIKDAFNEPKIINVSELEKTTADGLFKKDATDALGKQIEKDYDDKQYVELGQHKAYSIFKNALEIDENGVVSADSVSAAVQELAAMGASPRFIENVAAAVVNQNALLLGDGIQQQGASELMETVRQAVDEADRANRKKHLEAYRVAAKEQGVTDFEFDQMVRRMAWDDTLDDETAARNYYATKGIIWDALNSEEKIELVQTFTDTKMVNKEIDKNAAQVVGDYVGGRWLQTLSLGIASGAVGLADMVAGLGSTREQWEITKTLSDAYQWSAAYGKSDQSLGFKALNIGTTVANELIRMSTIGAAGKAVAGSRLVSNLNRTADYAGLFAKTATGMDKTVFGATKLFNRGLAALIKGSAHTTTQLVANAIGNNFAQAMSYTDENGNPPSRKDATLYAVVTGAFEGAVEALAMDKWTSKAIGSSKLAKTVMKGGKSLSSVSLDKKARLIHLAASALGEFGEESGSYALSCFMQRQTYNENAEFDAREFVESGLMGALIGFTGAAMNASSYNASNIVYEYMSNHGYDTDFFDLMHASVHVEALPQKMYDQYSQTNEWLTHDDYVSVQRDLVSHARQMESSKQNYYAAQKKINAETQLKIDAVSRLEAQLASLQDAPMSVDTANEIGNVMKALSVAQSELSLEMAQATQKLADLQSGYKETTAQHRAAMEKAQAKVDAHNVALYNTFLPDIARLKGLTTAEVQRTTAEAQERNANAILSENYRLQEFYEGLFDEMDAASNDAALAYSNLANANATIEQNSKLASDMKAKLLSMRVSAEVAEPDTSVELENSEFNSALESAANAYDQATEQTPVEQQNTEQPAQQPVTEAPQYIELDDDAINRVTELGNKLGRTVVIDDLPEGTNGRYDGDGILHINRKQLSNGDSPELIVFKHELTHSLETSKKYYARLANSVEDYARKSFEPNERFATFDEQYKAFAEEVRRVYEERGQQATDETVKREFVASFAEGHLFSDEAAIRSLAAQNSNLWSRTLNKVRYWLYGKAGISGTGSQAEQDLKQIERLYAMALHDAGIKPSDDVREFMDAATFLWWQMHKKNSGEASYFLWNSDTDESFFNDNYPHNEGENFDGVLFLAKDEDSPNLLDVKVNYDNVPDSLLGFSTHGRYAKDDPKYKYTIPLWVSTDGGKNYASDSMSGLNRPHTIARIQRNWVGDRIVIKERKTNVPVGSYQPASFHEHIGLDFAMPTTLTNNPDYSYHREGLSWENYLARDDGNVEFSTGISWDSYFAQDKPKVEYSDSFDSDGKQLSVGQQEYFKDSKVRDENGNLRVMWHGTASDFTIFDIERAGRNWGGDSRLGKGFYFTDNEQDALRWTDGTRTVKAYLNITNPLDVDAPAPKNIAEEIDKYIDNKAASFDDSQSFISKEQYIKNLERIKEMYMNDVSMFINEFKYDETGKMTDGIREFLSALGYDGIVSKSETVAFYPEQIKLTTNTTPTTNPDIRYSTGVSWDNLGKQYGVHKQGMNPRARESSVPLSTDGSNRTSKGVRTVMESPLTSEQMAQEIPDKVMDGLGVHDVKSLEDSVADGDQLIKDAGSFDAALVAFKERVTSLKDADATIAMGARLLSMAQESGRTDLYMDVLTDVLMAETGTGRGSNAGKLLKTLGGAGEAVLVQKVVNKINETNPRIVNGVADSIEIPEELMTELANAKSEYDIEAAKEKISKYIGENTPLTLSQQVRNWRYLSMLFNGRTHMRNLAGNTAMLAARKSKDALSAGIEKAFVHAGLMDDSERTHSVYSKSTHSEEYAAAEQAWRDNEAAIKGQGNKYGFDGDISKYQRYFRADWMESTVGKLAKANSKAMTAADDMFYQPAYIDAYTQFVVARGLNPKAMTEQDKAEANQYAKEYADKVTFKSASELANALNSIKNPVARFFIDATIPFAKTTFNVAKTMVEYSPIGLANGVVNAFAAVKSNNDAKSVSAAIDKMGAGLTGSALSVLGYFLAQAGILRGRGDEEEEIEAFNKSLGDVDFSINFRLGSNEVALSTNGISPMQAPLFMGVRLYEKVAAAKEDHDKLTLSDYADAALGIVDPLMEMSFMSSINEMLRSYGQGDAIGNIIESSAKSTVSQMFPTLGGQINKIIDPYARTTKGDITSSVGGTIDQFGRSLGMKTIGASYALEPSVNVKGETTLRFDDVGSWLFNFAQQMVLPDNITVKNKDAIDKELISIADSTGNMNILPAIPTKKYIRYNGMDWEMNAKQFTAYTKDLGQQRYSAIKKVMSLSNWNGMDDKQKASLLEAAIESADDAMKSKYLDILGAYDN